MKQYKVLRNTHGYKGRYWEEGKIAEFEDDDNPPHHFQLVGTEVEKPISNHYDPMNPIPTVPGVMLKPVGGFASVQSKEPPKPMETVSTVKQRGRPKKVI